MNSTAAIDSTCFHIGDDPQLFVDDVLIEASQGLTRKWHKPQRHSGGPVIHRDQPRNGWKIPAAKA